MTLHNLTPGLKLRISQHRKALDRAVHDGYLTFSPEGKLTFTFGSKSLMAYFWGTHRRIFFSVADKVPRKSSRKSSRKSFDPQIRISRVNNPEKKRMMKKMKNTALNKLKLSNH